MELTTRDPVAQLAALSWDVSGAQLVARGCAPVQPAGLADPDEALWGPGRTAALLHRSGLSLAPAVAEAAAALGARPELLLTLGADDRSIPVQGRNGYGFGVYEGDPVLRLSSCTAVPPDALALAVADRWRREQLASPSSPAALHRALATEICDCLGIEEGWADSLVLSSSGTEIESLLSAALVGTGGRPVLNVLVGAREAGSGTRLAAEGRRFQSRTPFGRPGWPQEVLAGFDGAHLAIVDVDVRDRAGRPRRAFDVEAEIDAHVDESLEAGMRVLVHVIDRSKSGLRQPTLGWVQQRLRTGAVRVVVDAAQGRLSVARLQAYLQAGASVLFTGSKALSGPPFSGALLLDARLRADLQRMSALPAGFADTMACADLPEDLQHLAVGWQPVNYGLLARWQVALAEWRALLDLPDRLGRKDRLVAALRASLSTVPGVTVLPGGSILSLTWADRTGVWERDRLAAVYARAVRLPGVQIGQPVELVATGASALRVAVGAATLTRLVDGSDEEVRAVAAVAREVLLAAST